MRPGVWKEICPDARTEWCRCILLAPFWRPAICTSKEGSGALRSSKVKLTGLSLKALWGGGDQCSSLLASGPWPRCSQGCPAPPGTWQSQGNAPHDVSHPHLQTAPAQACREGGTQIHTSRGRPHTPPSPGQGEIEAKKAEVEQTGGQAGRESGERQEEPSRETPCSSHRKPPKAGRRSTCKVQSHVRVRETKQAFKEI